MVTKTSKNNMAELKRELNLAADRGDTKPIGWKLDQKSADLLGLTVGHFLVWDPAKRKLLEWRGIDVN